MGQLKAVGGALPVAVESGQFYRCRRPGKPPRYVRVARVSRARIPPTAALVEVTRTGVVKRKGVRAPSTLTVRDGAWRLREGYELVEMAVAS